MQVSVFNGGTRSGLADETLAQLRERGFTPGDTGNAPSGTEVKRVRVLHHERNDLAATLVARQFGRSTKVVVTDTDLGPGVDVVVGNKFDKLAKARRVIVVRKLARSASRPRPAETGSDPGRLRARSPPSQSASRPRSDTARSRSSVASRNLRGVTTSMSSPRRSTVRWSGTSVSPVADQQRHRGPDRQPQLADLDAVQPRTAG